MKAMVLKQMKKKRIMSLLLVTALVMTSAVGIRLKVAKASMQGDAIVTTALAEYEKYKGQAYGGQYGSSPWCCNFVSWCARQSGISSNTIKSTATVQTMYDNLINSCGASVVTAPQKGDLVFYKYTDYDSARFHHIGIMISSSESVQGNVSNTWWKGRPNALNNIKEMVYVRPAYDKEPSTQTTAYFSSYNLNKTEDTNAEVYIKIENPDRKVVSSVGCEIYNENGVLLNKYSENCSWTTSYVNYTCNFVDDMHYRLTAGTKYKILLYAVVDGVRINDTTRTFETTGRKAEETKEDTEAAKEDADAAKEDTEAAGEEDAEEYTPVVTEAPSNDEDKNAPEVPQDDTNGIGIFAGNVTATSGEKFEVPVKIRNNSGIMGLGVEVKFDKNKVAPVDEIKAGSMLSGQFNNTIAAALKSGAGSFIVLWQGADEMKENGTVFTLKFKAKANITGTTKIELGAVRGETYDVGYNDVELKCGSVVITFTSGQKNKTDNSSPTATKSPGTKYDYTPLPNPKKVKIKSVKSKKKKKVTVRWAWLVSQDGYEVEYAKNRSFSGKKRKRVGEYSSEITIKKLKRKKKYYFRVRAVRYDDNYGVYRYGSWSKVKSCRVK